LGPNEVPYKIIKFYENILTPYFKRLFNVYLKQRIHPKIYKKTKIIVLKKPNKKIRDYSKIKTYKLIILFDIINKIFEKILALKLFVLIKNRILFPRAQIKIQKKDRYKRSSNY